MNEQKCLVFVSRHSSNKFMPLGESVSGQFYHGTGLNKKAENCDLDDL